MVDVITELHVLMIIKESLVVLVLLAPWLKETHANVFSSSLLFKFFIILLLIISIFNLFFLMQCCVEMVYVIQLMRIVCPARETVLTELVVCSNSFFIIC